MSGIAFSRLAGLAGLYLEIAWSIHRESYGKASNVHIPMILRIWSKSVQFSQCYVYFPAQLPVGDMYPGWGVRGA